MSEPRALSLVREIAETVATVVSALLIAVLFRFLAFQPYTIPSSSMEPGLVTGDYIVVSTFSYGWSRAAIPFAPPLFQGRILAKPAQRGDIVVFLLPANERKTLIKRVIGLPGDRVQLRHGTVFVNGAAIPQTLVGPGRDHDEPWQAVTELAEPKPRGGRYITFDRPGVHEGDDTGVYVVPQGHYFVMGDNRDNSLDSRWPASVGGVGFLPAENIVGKAQMVAWSWRAGASLFKPWTWLSLDPSRFFRRLS